MPMCKPFLAALLASCALQTTHAATHLVDFSGVPTGYHANGTEFGGVTFWNSGANGTVYVNDYGDSSVGQALETYDPGATGRGGVFMQFASQQSAMSLLFGNDDPTAPPGALAVLQLLSAGDVVAEVTLAMNRDDVANQTIGYAGLSFESAFFFMADAQGQSLAHFSEVIDNVRYSDVAAPVPEPENLALLAIGLTGVGAAARRRLRMG